MLQRKLNFIFVIGSILFALYLLLLLRDIESEPGTKNNLTDNPDIESEKDINIDLSNNMTYSLLKNIQILTKENENKERNVHTYVDNVLIATPVKDCSPWLDKYFENLYNLSYPHSSITLALLESDSSDDCYHKLLSRMDEAASKFRKVILIKKDFDFKLKYQDRHRDDIQMERRRVQAYSRNLLLYSSLQDEKWVAWLDLDIIEFPNDLLQRTISKDKDILTVNCLRFNEEGKLVNYDLNTRDKYERNLEEIRLNQIIEGKLEEVVEVRIVGGTYLLVRADVHRMGIMFPYFVVNGCIETEGFALIAASSGIKSYGMPYLKILHYSG